MKIFKDDVDKEKDLFMEYEEWDLCQKEQSF